MNIEDAAKCIQNFEGGELTDRLFNLEVSFRGVNKSSAKVLCEQQNMTLDLLKSAFAVKKLAGQINVLIHGVGILLILPEILHEDEHIEYLSLGAGNTGRQFDLETDKQVAEFKFINWQGGAEAIRQNSLFKDFFNLAEYDSSKRKFLYLLGTKIPLRFFNGNRAIKSVLSRNSRLERDFFTKYGNQFHVVYEYYNYHRDKVEIIDISNILPEAFDIENVS